MSEVNGAYRCPYCKAITDTADSIHSINANGELVCTFDDVSFHDTGELEKWLLDRRQEQEQPSLSTECPNCGSTDHYRPFFGPPGDGRNLERICEECGHKFLAR